MSFGVFFGGAIGKILVILEHMLFEEPKTRKPNLYPWTKDFISAIQNGFWSDKEFSFQSDIQDFKVKLSDQEREVIQRTVSAIGHSECKVKKYWLLVSENFPHHSIFDLSVTLSANECVHNSSYERLLEVLDLEHVFEENLQTEVLKGRIEYLNKHLNKNFSDNKKQYIYSIILFTLFVEYVSLFSQFYIILWFGRYRNVLKDTNQQVLYTRTEEGLHFQVGVKFIETLREEYPQYFDKELEDRVRLEAAEAFKFESKMIDWMLGDFTGERINPTILKEYVKNRLNSGLTQMGIPPVFVIDQNISRDFEWMNEEVLGNTVTDFFYKRPTSYQKKFKPITKEELF